MFAILTNGMVKLQRPHVLEALHELYIRLSVLRTGERPSLDAPCCKHEARVLTPLAFEDTITARSLFFSKLDIVLPDLSPDLFLFPVIRYLAGVGLIPTGPTKGPRK